MNANNKFIDKLSIGTVQFGMDYGVNNGHKVDQLEAQRILNVFDHEYSILLDTAPSYGVAEQVVAKECQTQFSVVSKVAPVVDGNIEHTLNSLNNTYSLFSEKLYGLILHKPSDLNLFDYKKVLKKIESMQKIGIKVGVSIYREEELDMALDYMSVDLVQLPVNILDQRFLSEEFLNKIRLSNIELHSRSCFLQGLLLMPFEKTNAYFSNYESVFNDLYSASKEIGMSIYELCLYFVFKQTIIDKVIIGLDNESQAKELVSTLKKIETYDIQYDLSKFKNFDENLILPSNWKLI